jgi:hypothetical protein
MTARYHVSLDGPRTAITESPDGECPRWHMARAAAIEHLEEHIAACEEALWVLRHGGSFWEYETLRGGDSRPRSPGRRCSAVGHHASLTV